MSYYSVCVLKYFEDMFMPKSITTDFVTYVIIL